MSFFLDKKNLKTLIQLTKKEINNIATYNAIAIYSENLYTLTLQNSNLTAIPDFFSLRFIAPNNYITDAVFVFDEITYAPVNASFETNQVVFANFNKTEKKVYFSAGKGGSTDASDIKVASFVTTDTEYPESDVQSCIKDLYINFEGHSSAINTLNDSVSAINSDVYTLRQNLETLQNIINNLDVTVYTISNTAPTNTKRLWIDTSSTPNVMKYYNGTAWVGVVGVWG